jgi:hypothetical protein
MESVRIRNRSSDTTRELPDDDHIRTGVRQGHDAGSEVLGTLECGVERQWSPCVVVRPICVFAIDGRMKRRAGMELMSDSASIGTRPVKALLCTAALIMPLVTSSVRSALASPLAYALTAT